MATKDVIRYEVLEDGTISIETDRVSGVNHVSADEMLAQLDAVMGGTRKTRKREGHEHKHASVGKHTHDHGHVHH